VVRGFNQGNFTLDGVPLGDMSYGNHNGLHIRAIPRQSAACSCRRARADVVNTLGTIGSSRPIRRVDGRLDRWARPARRLRVDSGGLGEGGPRFCFPWSTARRKRKGAGDQEQRPSDRADRRAGSLSAFYNDSDRGSTQIRSSPSPRGWTTTRRTERRVAAANVCRLGRNDAWPATMLERLRPAPGQAGWGSRLPAGHLTGYTRGPGPGAPYSARRAAR
jgi:hypothetical protein